eukprot:403338414
MTSKKKCFLLFLSIALLALNTKAGTVEDAAGGIVDKVKGNDTTNIQKVFFLMNYLDFCVLPRTTLASYKYFQAYYRQLGFDKEQNMHLIDENFLLNRTFDYNPDVYRIPLKSHRIWITSPNNPREMLDVLVDEDLQAKLARTSKILDEAAERDPYNKDGKHKWQHIFWVNDKKLIPRSVKFMEESGFIVRELTELQIFDDVMLEALIDYIETDRVGAAADFARMAINYETGGFYIDLDFWLKEWDMNINKIFDFFGFKCGEFVTSYVLFTWGFLSRAKHPIHLNYLTEFKKNYLLQRQKERDGKPLHLLPCWVVTSGSTLYDTGPYFYDNAYFQTFMKGQNDQILVVWDITHQEFWSNKVKVSTGEEITLRIAGFQPGQGSWANDYIDAANFGFPELNEYKF